MTQSFFRTTVLTAALLAMGGSAAWAQTAPQNETPAGAPASDAGVHDSASDSEQPVTDTWITTKVKTELAVTEGVKSMDISVQTRDGMVTLTGTQPSDTAVQKAEAAAQSIKGVKDVDVSGLKVDGDAASDDESASVGEAVSDGWITTKVKAELATTDGVSSNDVSVTTHDGVVTLTGVLESDTAVQKAEAAAKSVKGVQEVDSAGLKAEG